MAMSRHVTIIAVCCFILSVIVLGLSLPRLPVPQQSSTEILATLPPSAVIVEPEPVLLTFFGDMMLGRNVEVLTNKHGQDYLFEKIDAFLSAQNYLIANLEGPIVTDHAITPTGSFSFSFQNTSADFLARHGFNLVSLANNHTSNQGNDGFAETQSFLATAGIVSVGHPIDAGAEYVKRVTVSGRELLVAGFNETFVYNDPDQAVQTIADARATSDDPIIVFMHWGTEYALHSSATQEALAHRLIDAGASVIIGAHPHVVQEVEQYNGKWIFYSLGNFIFDQYFSVDTQQGLVVALSLDADGSIGATLYPMQSAFSQPSLMAEPERSAFLQALAVRSDPAIADQVAEGQLLPNK